MHEEEGESRVPLDRSGNEGYSPKAYFIHWVAGAQVARFLSKGIVVKDQFVCMGRTSMKENIGAGQLWKSAMFFVVSVS